MLSVPGSVKVLVSKDFLRSHRGASAKGTVVTAVECVSMDGKYLDAMIIWLASPNRLIANVKTPGWH